MSTNSKFDRWQNLLVLLTHSPNVSLCLHSAGIAVVHNCSWLTIVRWIISALSSGEKRASETSGAPNKRQKKLMQYPKKQVWQNLC